MLGKPHYGRVKISMNDWNREACYPDDVAIMLLAALNRVIRTRKPAAVKFSAGVAPFTILFDTNQIHIISEDGKTLNYKSYEVRIEDLTSEIIGDIRSHIRSWASWGVAGVMSDEKRTERVADIEILCLCVEAKMGEQRGVL